MAIVNLSLQINGFTLSADIVEPDRTVAQCLPQIAEAASSLEAAFDLPNVQRAIMKLSTLRGENAVVVDFFPTLECRADGRRISYYAKNETFSKFGFKLPAEMVADYCRAAAIEMPSRAGVFNHLPVALELVNVNGKMFVKGVKSGVVIAS